MSKFQSQKNETAATVRKGSDQHAHSRHQAPPSTTNVADAIEITRALDLLLSPGQVTELRALDVVDSSYRKPHTIIGYFDDPKKLASAAASIDRAKGIYIVLNPIRQDLLARAANRTKSGRDVNGTADSDILFRRWLPIDLDPVRPSGISSNDDEHQSALDRAQSIRDALDEIGFPDPVLADSGNGAHLLYRIDLPADDGGLVEQVLEALAFRFDDQRVTVDTAVGNPARIWKLYGTRACKGDSTADRPHRMSRLLHVPDDLTVVSEALLVSVTAWLPQPTVERPADRSSRTLNDFGQQRQLDLENWIAEHDLDVVGPCPWQDGRKWIFPVCPWNPDHGNASAFIVQFNNGAISAGCHHDSCKDRDWHSLRALYDPEWTEKARDPQYSAKSANSAGINLSWDLPASFDLSDSKLPDFPTEAFPNWLQAFVDAEAEATQTPRALAGSVALAVCATAASKVAVVRHGASWTEPLNLFTVVVMPPGTRKSSVFGHVIAPLEIAELELIESSRAKIAEAREVRDVIEAQRKLARKRASKAKDPSERAAALEEATDLARQLAACSVPAEPRLVLNDVTPEKVASVLAEQGSVAIMSPEGDVFEMMAGRYAMSGSPNLGVYLSGHAGDGMRVDRINRPSESIRNPALTIGLTVQPEVLRGLVEKPGFRGRGLLGRFLYAIPETALGRRRIDPPPVTDIVSFNYGAAVRQLLTLAPNDDSARHSLQLSQTADAVFHDFQQAIETKLADDGEFMGMRDWAGKLPGAALRLAGIVHLTEHVEAAEPWHFEITAETIERAITLANFFTEHATAAFRQMGADPRIADARYVLRRIAQSGLDVFTRRNAFEATKGRFKIVLELDPVLRLIEAHGYIRQLPREERSGPGRSRSPRYEVNPRWQREEEV